MDAISLIKDDHAHVKDLFDKFESASQKKERQALATQIIEELSVHASVEEQLVYPTLRRLNPDSEEDVLNALEEHHVAKLVLAELDRMDADEERFAAKMHVLRENIESHIEEEELELLPLLREQFSEDELEALGQAMTAMKEAAPNHPHPLAPDTPTASVVAAAVAKIGDAGKDLLRRITGSDKAEGHARAVEHRRAKAAKKAAPARKTATRAKPARKAARSR